jgi:hypothetical protein
VKKLRVCRVDTPNGEIHFLLDEPPTSGRSESFKDTDAVEIKMISRKEAAKPLVLFREE